MTTAVARQNAARHRYELLLDDSVVCIVDYQLLADDVVVLTHVETDPAHRGQGRAAELMQHAMDDLRASGKRALPRCPYAVAYLAQHHEYDDLVVAE